MDKFLSSNHYIVFTIITKVFVRCLFESMIILYTNQDNLIGICHTWAQEGLGEGLSFDPLRGQNYFNITQRICTRPSLALWNHNAHR